MIVSKVILLVVVGLSAFFIYKLFHISKKQNK
jgi:hypothetical protein